jgi:alcohol dehydrogenase
MVQSGKLSPERLVGRKITLSQSVNALMSMEKAEAAGATVITDFTC